MLAPDPESLASAVGDMLSHPDKLKQASAAAARLGKPDSAQAVAGEIVAYLTR